LADILDLLKPVPKIEKKQQSSPYVAKPSNATIVVSPEEKINVDSRQLQLKTRMTIE